MQSFQNQKATRIELFNFRTPQMRAFHMTWFAFFVCFFAWFGIAPLMKVVREELGLTPAQVGNTIIASVAATVLARMAIGQLCDRFGPRRTYAGLLILSSFPVMAIGLANSYEAFLLFRLGIGVIGASFVITQYHTSLMFAPNIVGTANATTAGWGNLGGGVTQMVMPLVFTGFMGLGFPEALSWRLAMLVAGLICLGTGIAYYFLTQDTPAGNFEDLPNHPRLTSRGSFRQAARDYRVWVLFVLYAACFGIELTINNIAALYFADYFSLDLKTAGTVAALFGLNLALINLSLLKGQIGRPGMGPFSLTGQPNAMGGREVGAMANLLPAHRDLNNPDHRAEVAAFWGVPSLSDRPGLTATEMIDALEAGRLKAIWIIGTNPALSQPELARLERAFARAELVVVQEISTRAATLQWADVVLPAASWLEKQGTMTNSERRITYLPRLLDPPGEARPDVWILCDFARRMGWKHAFDYQDESEIFNEYARLTQGTPIDISGVSYERLQRERSIQWPCPAPNHPGTPRLFTSHRFLTPSGRARLHPVPEPAPPEPPSPKFPFILTTGRVRDQWHTRTKTGKVARLNQHAPEPFLEMHPDDAAACGLSEGALAEITGRTGKLTVRVRLTSSIKRGVVFLPMHWGQETETADARVNMLIPCRIDPISRQPAFKFARVQVAPRQRQRQRIVIIGAGAAARAFLEAYRKHNDTDELYLFGREPYGFYNRVQLPEYLSGQRTFAQLRTLADAQLNALQVHFYRGVEVINVDRTARVVHGSNGVSLPYDRLVLATGSRPFIPPGIPITWPNVFTLRTLADADAIRTRLAGSQHVLILGGGLLGLEVAAALHEAGYTCTILELADRLMARQLDETAAALLREELEARGICIYCNDAPETFLGTDCFEGVRTRTGRTLTADLLLVAVGTRPETQLAARIGLNVHRGVCVNDPLQTSDPAIYAIGEVAEHRGQLYGTTSAAEEQARVAAAHIAGDVWARYSGSVPFNILKIPGFDLCTLGQSVVPPDAPAYEEVVLLDRKRRIYQKVVVRHNRLVGAMVLGDRSAFAQFQQLIAKGLELDVPPHRLLQGSETAEPPEGPIVCSCYNVGRGNLERAIAEGCTELEDLCRRTRAGTGCGSCRPELQMLLEARRHRTPVAA